MKQFPPLFLQATKVFNFRVLPVLSFANICHPTPTVSGVSLVFRSGWVMESLPQNSPHREETDYDITFDPFLPLMGLEEVC